MTMCWMAWRWPENSAQSARVRGLSPATTTAMAWASMRVMSSTACSSGVSSSGSLFIFAPDQVGERVTERVGAWLPVEPGDEPDQVRVERTVSSLMLLSERGYALALGLHC